MKEREGGREGGREREREREGGREEEEDIVEEGKEEKRRNELSSAITEQLRGHGAQPNMEQSQISIHPNREYTLASLHVLNP